ncbi:MAG: glutaredoxin 3 [Sphingomonadaceae bacterium]
MADNPHPKVEMYVKWGCPYCIRAKSIFDRKGVEVTEYEIAGNEERRAEMVERAPGSRTVPQIFIDDLAIGGSDNLARIDAEGKLDELLGL